MLALTTPPKVPYPTRYVIDPVAFFAALIGVPLLFTALTVYQYLRRDSFAKPRNL